MYLTGGSFFRKDAPFTRLLDIGITRKAFKMYSLYSLLRLALSISQRDNRTMLKPGGYEKYIEDMLANPNIRPVYEEFYAITGKYPPFFLDFDYSDEDALIYEVRLLIEMRKKRLAPMFREKVSL